jgi:hypothetical protein
MSINELNGKRIVMNDIEERLDRIEQALQTLIEKNTVKEYYSTHVVAKILGRAPFTVQQYARSGRIRAEKRKSGRGKHLSWVISHDELLRIQREGLIPAKH